MLRSIDISTSGLVAQRQRMTTLAENIANANTTQDEDGNITPFKRRYVAFRANEDATRGSTRGVGVKYEVKVDTEKPRIVHDPGHEHADADGDVRYPAINVIKEFINMMEASRAYELNVSAVEMSKEMAAQTLRIIA